MPTLRATLSTHSVNHYLRMSASAPQTTYINILVHMKCCTPSSHLHNPQAPVGPQKVPAEFLNRSSRQQSDGLEGGLNKLVSAYRGQTQCEPRKMVCLSDRRPSLSVRWRTKNSEIIKVQTGILETTWQHHRGQTEGNYDEIPVNPPDLANPGLIGPRRELIG